MRVKNCKSFTQFCKLGLDHFTKLNLCFAQINMLCRSLFSMSPTEYHDSRFRWIERGCPLLSPLLHITQIPLQLQRLLKVTNFRPVLIFVLLYFWKKYEFCFGALEFQRYSVLRPSKSYENYRKTPLISTYVFSGLVTEQVLVFGAVLTFGGYDEAEWKILQGRSLYNPVLSAHNTLLCMFQRLCTYFQDTGVLIFGGNVLSGHCNRQ